MGELRKNEFAGGIKLCADQGIVRKKQLLVTHCVQRRSCLLSLSDLNHCWPLSSS